MIATLQIICVWLALVSKVAVVTVDDVGNTTPCEHVTCDKAFSCNPYIGTCFPDPPEVDRPYAWLGQGPDDCTQQPSDCDLFGFDYLDSHLHDGLGNWCLDGVFIRCISKKAPSLPNPTPANHFRVMTYNVYERPFIIVMDGQRERTCRIPRAIASQFPDVDVVILQEVFMGGCFPDQTSLRDLFAQHGFLYSTATVSCSGFQCLWTPELGGVFIVSRWPILDEDQHVFSAVLFLSADSMVAKGVSYAKIEKTVSGVSITYHVMGTHFQAGRASVHPVRMRQAQEWADFVTRKDIPVNEPLILAGDLNTCFHIEYSELQEILPVLDVALPPIMGPINGTSHSTLNDILLRVNPGGTELWLDYVTYGKSHRIPSEASQQAFLLRDDAFPVCFCTLFGTCLNFLRGYSYPYPETCSNIANIRDLSDHFPVVATFVF